MGILKMAWRNLWRHSRRTIVTVAAMTLALFVLILYTGLLEGYLQNMEGNILDLELGDVQVHAGDYLNRPSIYTRIERPEALLHSLESQGYHATARLLGGGLVAAGDSSAGASFRGVDVARDREVSKIGEHVSQGVWLDPAEPKGVVLGRRLARTLNVETGDELVFLGQAAEWKYGERSVRSPRCLARCGRQYGSRGGFSHRGRLSRLFRTSRWRSSNHLAAER